MSIYFLDGVIANVGSYSELTESNAFEQLLEECKNEKDELLAHMMNVHESGM